MSYLFERQDFADLINATGDENGIGNSGIAGEIAPTTVGIAPYTRWGIIRKWTANRQKRLTAGWQELKVR